METKQNIRRQIRDIVRSMASADLEELSGAVCGKVYERVVSAGRRNAAVLLYWSLPDEVDTHALVERLYGEGFRVLLPVVVGDAMILREYRGVSAMKPGPFGILEPQGDTFTAYAEIDFAFVPGRAFTVGGKRLGRGRGYYDRFLAEMECPLAGMCFPFQIVEDIPTEPHDVVMDDVIC